MARDRKDLGSRKFVRVDLRKPGFLIPAPDAPWISATSSIFPPTVPASTSATWRSEDVRPFADLGGEVRRVCSLIWRKGEMVGVRFISARELRKGVTGRASAGGFQKGARLMSGAEIQDWRR